MVLVVNTVIDIQQRRVTPSWDERTKVLEDFDVAPPHLLVILCFVVQKSKPQQLSLEATRNLLVCLLWVLKNMASDVLRDWWADQQPAKYVTNSHFPVTAQY